MTNVRRRKWPQPTEADIARFMSYVDVLPNGCHYWMGARSKGKGNKKTYGSFRYQGVTVRAHAFSAEFIKCEPCPPGCHRDHNCCFSMCVAPDHIDIVTHEENQRRKMERRNAS